MNVIGTVISVEMDKTITKNGGGSYKGTGLLYRDESGSAKEQNFHNNALKYNPQLKDSLSSLIPGDQFTMVKEKEGEYWNVKSITKNSGNSGVNSVSNKTPPNTTQGKGTWETSEERAKKQVYIVRQSSISAAVALAATKKVPPTVEDVIATAKLFEAYVFSDGVESDPDMDDNVE